MTKSHNLKRVSEMAYVAKRGTGGITCDSLGGSLFFMGDPL